jgi:hypothetical protein
LSTWAVVDACATFIKVVKYRIKKKKRAWSQRTTQDVCFC